MNEKYQSELLGALHETASDLHKIGAISNEEMKEYDRDCLIQTPKAAPKSVQSPARENVTPAVV